MQLLDPNRVRPQQSSDVDMDVLAIWAVVSHFYDGHAQEHFDWLTDFCKEASVSGLSDLKLKDENAHETLVTWNNLNSAERRFAAQFLGRDDGVLSRGESRPRWVEWAKIAEHGLTVKRHQQFSQHEQLSVVDIISENIEKYHEYCRKPSERDQYKQPPVLWNMVCRKGWWYPEHTFWCQHPRAGERGDSGEDADAPSAKRAKH